MFNLFKRFIHEGDGQDFAEYTLILGAIGVVAIAVVVHAAYHLGEIRQALCILRS